MDSFENGVPFDPGYAPYVAEFQDNIEAIYYQISKFKAPHQKRFKFTQYEPMILDLINNNAGFYLGCILWGSYIYYKFKDTPKKITGNPFTNLTDEQLKDINHTENIDYIINFLPKFDKDCKYFTGKASKVRSNIMQILENYREFVLLNDGFINTESTNEVKIPENCQYLKNADTEKLDSMYSSIKSILQTGKLEDILEIEL